ncbi:MAG: hypothetical protein ACYDAD_11825 [Acidimicrobiales bacterium]
MEPEMWMSDPSTGLSLRYDHAYWISGVRVSPGAEKGTVDATSLARSDRERTGAHVVGAGQNLTSGADLCGPNAAVQTGDAWRLNGIALSRAARAPITNAARLSMSAVAAATLDLAPMSLASASPLVLNVVADRRGDLRLLGRWTGPVRFTVDGVRSASLPTIGGAVTVPLRAGSHAYVVG